MSTVSTGKPLRTRSEALQRRTIRNAWLCMLVGLIIPFIALWGAVMGWQVRPAAPRAGWSLVVVGVTIFVVRMAIYLG